MKIKTTKHQALVLSSTFAIATFGCAFEAAEEVDTTGQQQAPVVQDIATACSGLYFCEDAHGTPEGEEKVFLYRYENECHLARNNYREHRKLAATEAQGNSSTWMYDAASEDQNTSEYDLPRFCEKAVPVIESCFGTYRCEGEAGTIEVVMHKDGDRCFAGDTELTTEPTVDGDFTTSWRGHAGKWNLTIEGKFFLRHDWTCERIPEAELRPAEYALR